MDEVAKHKVNIRQNWQFCTDLAEWILGREDAPEEMTEMAKELLDDIAELAARGEI